MKEIKASVIANGDIKNYIENELIGRFIEYNKQGLTAMPSLVDVHVHFREPGFSYKETIASGCSSGARGGYTTVFTMPNLNPVPDSVENIKAQLQLINAQASINVYPYASITIGEKGEVLTDINALSKYAIAFSDDGRGVQDQKMMEDAMRLAKENGKLICAHCEDNSLLFGGYIHKGLYAEKNGHRGISSQSEYKQIERDLELVAKTGVSYHVCHVSAKESVALIRKAKKSGLDVSCETAPHYLILSDKDLLEEGRFKMNPPLRDESDKLALIDGVLDGTIEIIATDHAPHSMDEKSKGLEKSAFGVVGLETAFSSLYTHLVKKGIITIEKLVEIMAINPRKRFNLSYDEGFTVFDLESEYIVNPSEFLSKGRATPFENMKFNGVCKLTALGGVAVYKN